MGLDIILILAIIGIVILLFLTRWVRLDVIPLLVPPALILSRLVSPEEVFSGFSSAAVITVAALFVVTAGLVRSGVVHRMVEYLKHITAGDYFRLSLASTVLPGILAGFINITATYFFFAPMVMRLALYNSAPRSKFLLPMAAACLLGANLTLTGASHNLVVNSLLLNSTGISFTFFEFLPAGVLLLSIAVVYSLLLGSRLLPAREEGMEQEDNSPNNNLAKVYDLYDRLWELWVDSKSPALGKSLQEAGLGAHYGLSVIAVVRAKNHMPAEREGLRLDAEDILLVLGREEKVKYFAEQEGLLLAGRPRDQKSFPLNTAELVEVMIPPRSEVIGKTLTELNFRAKAGLSVIALWHEGKPLRTDVGNQQLQEGDGLLLYGDREKTRGFKPGKNFRWLHPPQDEEAPLKLRPLGPYAALLFLLVVVSAALGWLPVSVAALCGAAGMILLRILTPKQAYESIEWRTIILIGCLFPLGIALVNSGASALLAELLVSSLEYFGPRGVLLGVTLVTILFTQPLHNATVAVIMTPVALDVAQVMGANPKTFAVAVVIGASAGLLMPVGHPALLLTQQLGNYKPGDYLRFGLGLILIVLLISVFVVPLLWPF